MITRWDRVQKAYNAIALGEGEHAATAHEAMEQSYANGVTDEFVVPGYRYRGRDRQGDDAIIFANFRPTVRVRSPVHSLIRNSPALSAYSLRSTTSA